MTSRYDAFFQAEYDDASRAQTETWLVLEKDGEEFLRTPDGFYSACSEQEDALVLAADALNVHEATGLTPSRLQARVAELEAALRLYQGYSHHHDAGNTLAAVRHFEKFERELARLLK